MHTRQQAERLGLGGWVRNLPDGRVEGMASGNAAGLTAFREWLHQGPDLAMVTDVAVEEVEFSEFVGFIIK